MTPNLHRIKWGVRVVLALAVAASVGANVLHAQPNWTSRAFAAWAPLCLLGAIELVAKVPMSRRAATIARVAAMVAIAFIAAWVSYWQQAGVLKHYGERDHGAQYALPLTIDGLIVIASVSLVEIAGRIRAAQSLAPRIPEPPAAQASGFLSCVSPEGSPTVQPALTFAPEPAAQPTADAAQDPTPRPLRARSVARPHPRATRNAQPDNPLREQVLALHAQMGQPSAAKIVEAMNGEAPPLRTVQLWINKARNAQQEGSDA